MGDDGKFHLCWGPRHILYLYGHKVFKQFKLTSLLQGQWVAEREFLKDSCFFCGAQN